MKDGVEALGDLEIVGRAERAPAETVEIEARDAADGLGHAKKRPSSSISAGAPRSRPVRARKAASSAASALGLSGV